MSHPLAQNGAALAPFRANGAHPSYAILHTKFLAVDSLCCIIVDSVSNVKATTVCPAQVKVHISLTSSHKGEHISCYGIVSVCSFEVQIL